MLKEIIYNMTSSKYQNFEFRYTSGDYNKVVLKVYPKARSASDNKVPSI